MSRLSIDFLENSFLFLNKNTANMYADYSDAAVVVELQRYKSFIDANLKNAIDEIDKSRNHINVVIDTFGLLPDANRYKQMALYMNQVVIPDPIYELSSKSIEKNDTISSFMGMLDKGEINRNNLIAAVNYVKGIAALIKAGFAILLPITRIHERGDDIPIVKSESLFSELLPPNLLEIYKSSARVHNIKRTNNKMVVDVEGPLTTGTTICINFDGTFGNNGMVYQYTNVKLVEDDGKGKCVLRFTIPDSIEEKAFNTWVEQSINQAAARHFRAREAELLLAREMGCMYLTDSTLTAEALRCVVDNNDDGERTSAAISLDLPVIESLTAEDIIEIRNNYGDAFENFRNDLNLKLSKLNDIDDNTIFLKTVQQIENEIINTTIQDLEKEKRKLSKMLHWDAAATVGTLVASYYTGGLTTVGSVAALANGIKDFGKYRVEVKEHNGFFMWKLKERASKYTV